MWEWEDPPENDGGNDAPTEAAKSDLAKELADQRKLDLTRRKEQQKIEEQINSAISDRIGMLKNQMEVANLNLQSMENFAKALDTANKRQEKLMDLKKKMLDQDKNADTSAIDAEMDKLKTQSIDKMRDKLQDLTKDFKETAGEGSTLAKAADHLVTEFVAGNMSIEAFSEGMDTLRAKLEASGKGVDAVNKGVSFLAGKLGLSAKASDTAFGKMIEGAAQFGQTLASSPKMALQAVSGALLSLFSPLNIIGMAIKFMIDLFVETEKAAIDMTKSLNIGVRDSQKLLASMSAEMLDLNINSAELSKSFTSLGNTIANFDVESELGKDLAKTGAMLNKLGVDTETYAKSVNKLRYQFGGSAGDIKAASNQLVRFTMNARQMGITATKAMSDFNQIAGSVASMGGNATEELTRLQAMSKATGVEIAKMTAIAKKFNTFKDGADAAARLNSVFGTSLSSIDLMGKTAAERNETIAESLNMATGGYDMMTDHQKLAAAEMLGFGDDVLALEGFMKGQTEAEKAAAEEKLKNAEAMKEMQKAVSSLVPTLTQLINKVKQAFLENKSFQAAMTAIIDHAPTFIKFFEDSVHFFALAAAHIDKLTLLYAGYKAMQMLVAVAQAARVTTTVALTTAEGTATVTTTAFAMSAKKLGLIVIGVVGAMALLAYGIAAIGREFRQRKSPAVYELPQVMAGSDIILAIALYFLAPALMKAGVGVIFLGAGLSLIFYTFSLVIDAVGAVVKTIVDFISKLSAGTDNMFVFAGGLLAIGLGFVGLGKMALIASGGIAAGALALAGLRASMALTGTSFDDIIGTGNAVLAMGTGIVSLANGISGLGTAARDLMSGLGGKNLVVSKSGDQTTVLAGKGGLVAFVPPRITVDVKMDDKISMPPPIVNVLVQVDGNELRSIVREEIANSRD